MNMLTSALSLAKRGLPVFPLHRPFFAEDHVGCSCDKIDCKNIGKHPNARYAPHGLIDATTDAARITHWWQCVPDANIGVATGHLVVIDVDPQHGGDDSLHKLETEHGELPHTIRVITGGGGEHIFFEATAEIGNSTGKLAAGIDVRGVGGYVVAPPSLHRSGRRYAWSVDHHPDNTAVAPLPDWIVAAVKKPAGNGADILPTPPFEWRELVENGVVEGTRDCTVAKLAGYLLRRRNDPYVVLELLQCWNVTRCIPPLPAADIKRIVNSIAGREIKRRAHG
jgi:Bifunctional DNA primase/polymerase, N-terminal/Primase C terminal 1 (PriCT-1)